MEQCPIDIPFLCTKNNKCVTSFKFCEIDKYFYGDGLSFCEDYICRENCGNIDYSNSIYALTPKNTSFNAGNF